MVDCLDSILGVDGKPLKPFYSHRRCGTTHYYCDHSILEYLGFQSGYGVFVGFELGNCMQCGTTKTITKDYVKINDIYKRMKK